MRRTLVVLALLLGVAGTALGVQALWIEPRSLVVTEAEIASPRWTAAPLKVALIADPQPAGPHITAERFVEIVARVNRAQPDIILLLGDYVSTMRLKTSFVPPEALAQVLADLRAPLGVYAVLGNQDWWLDGARVADALTAVGIRVLDNQSIPIDRGADRFWLAGVGDIATGNADLPMTLEAIPADAPVLLMTHSPDLFPRVPARVALTVAGHTHGGQVKLPWFGRPLVPSQYGQRYAYGHVIEDDRHLFVSSGIGNATLPLRFGVPPEVVVITLKG